MRILVTGAGGQTGKAVIKAFIKKGIDVCAMVHRENQVVQMAEMGVRNVAVGDINGSSFGMRWMRQTPYISFVPREIRMNTEWGSLR